MAGSGQKDSSSTIPSVPTSVSAQERLLSSPLYLSAPDGNRDVVLTPPPPRTHHTIAKPSYRHGTASSHTQWNGKSGGRTGTRVCVLKWSLFIAGAPRTGRFPCVGRDRGGALTLVLIVGSRGSTVLLVDYGVRVRGRNTDRHPLAGKEGENVCPTLQLLLRIGNTKQKHTHRLLAQRRRLFRAEEPEGP